MTQTGLIAPIALGMLVTLSGQAPNATFEVASVRRNVSDVQSFNVSARPGGAYTATNTPLHVVIQFAYDLRDYQLVGGPSWVRTDRFDIAARAGRDVSTGELRQMLRSLLEERFKLVVRRVQREMPHYVVVVAREDGRLGPDLKRVGDDCSAVRSPDAPPALTTTPGDKRVALAGPAPGFNCLPISGVADLAARVMDVPVIDKTGLTGGWEFALRFGSVPGQSFGRPAVPAASDPSLPSFAAALREQLGLELKPAVGPVDVLVIESIRPPSDN